MKVGVYFYFLIVSLNTIEPIPNPADMKDAISNTHFKLKRALLNRL